MLLAAGAVATERFIERRRSRIWLRPASVALLLLGGTITAPYVLPILPVERVPRYLELLGMKDVRPERREEGDVPQLFADMLGRHELVAAVAKAYDGLAPDERARVAIWGSGYGNAGAIDFLGAAYGLPKAISGHQNYFLWGPRDYTGELVITIGIPDAVLRPLFRHVDLAATVACRYCMPDRRETQIHLCHGLKQPLQEIWPDVKCWTCDQPAIVRKTLSAGGS